VLSAFAALVLTAAPLELNDDGRGAPGTSPELYGVKRQIPRFRFGVGSVANLAAQDWDSFTSFAGGFGLSLEVGVVLLDSISILYRGELTTTVGSLYGSNGVFMDFAIGEHLAIGGGVALTLWSQLAYLGPDYVRSFAGFTFPLRAHVTWGSRKDLSVTSRAGWTISFHLAPGVTLYPVSYNFAGLSPPGFALTGGIGVGHLWW
jgi:hypothetical protein